MARKRQEEGSEERDLEDELEASRLEGAAGPEAKLEAAKELVSALYAEVVSSEFLKYSALGIVQQLAPKLEKLEQVLSA